MDFNLGWNPPRVVFGKFRRVGKVVTVTVQALEQKVLTDPTYQLVGHLSFQLSFLPLLMWMLLLLLKLMVIMNPVCVEFMHPDISSFYVFPNEL